MKILYHHRIRSKDGQFVHIEELVGALRDLGHEVIVVGPAAVERQAFGFDSGLLALMKRHVPAALYELLEFAYNLRAFARLCRAYLRVRPDAVYERYNLFLVAGAWLKGLVGVPWLVEVNAPLSDERRRYGGLALRRLARWGECLVLRRADAVLTVTAVLGRWVGEAGVPAERIVVRPNGVDLRRFEDAPETDRAKRALGLEGKLVIGFTGFIRGWHRLDQVIDYLSRASTSEVHFLVVGDGPDLAALEDRARAGGVGGRVTFSGLVPRDRIRDYVAAFDIALQPAVTEYASPLKMLEYMYLGRAIVAPDLANIRELLEDGVNACLFDPDDARGMATAIERLVADPGLRARIGAAARVTIVDRDLTWRHNAATVLDLIGKAAAAKPLTKFRQRPAPDA